MIGTVKGWLLSKYNTPYPYLFSTKRNIMLAALVSVMIIAINWALTSEDYVSENFSLTKPVLCLLAGAITFLSIITVVELIPRWFFTQEFKEKWVAGHEFLLTVCLLFIIAFFNNLVFYLLQKGGSNDIFLRFLNASFYTALIGVIPIILIIWSNYVIILKRNLKAVSLYNQQLQAQISDKEKPDVVVKIPTNNISEELELDLDEFLFAKSDGNYVDVFTKNTKGPITYRLSIQKLDECLSQYFFIMSPHRSYLINVNNIERTSGNARNYRVSFEGISHEVPVSRNRFQLFKDTFNKSYNSY